MKYLTDLRFVIGLFFLVVGIILILTSLFGPSDIIVNIGIKGNLWVGLPILVFAGSMLFASLRSKAK